MIEALMSFITIIWLAIRGNTMVTSEDTEVVYKCHLDLSTKIKGLKTVYMTCRELRHTLVYDKWYMPSQVLYSYILEVVKVTEEGRGDAYTAHYPLLCSRLIPNRTYPHRCAVNAHIDYLVMAHR